MLISPQQKSSIGSLGIVGKDQQECVLDMVSFFQSKDKRTDNSLILSPFFVVAFS